MRCGFHRTTFSASQNLFVFHRSRVIAFSELISSFWWRYKKCEAGYWSACANTISVGWTSPPPGSVRLALVHPDIHRTFHCSLLFFFLSFLFFLSPFFTLYMWYFYKISNWKCIYIYKYIYILIYTYIQMYTCDSQTNPWHKAIEKNISTNNIHNGNFFSVWTFFIIHI